MGYPLLKVCIMEAISSEKSLDSVCCQNFEHLQEIPYIDDLLPRDPSAYTLEMIQKVERLLIDYVSLKEGHICDYALLYQKNSEANLQSRQVKLYDLNNPEHASSDHQGLFSIITGITH